MFWSSSRGGCSGRSRVYKRRDSGGRDFLFIGIHVSNAKIERKINFVVRPTFPCVVQNIEIYPFQTLNNENLPTNPKVINEPLHASASIIPLFILSLAPLSPLL